MSGGHSTVMAGSAFKLLLVASTAGHEEEHVLGHGSDLMSMELSRVGQHLHSILGRYHDNVVSLSPIIGF